MAFLAAGIVVAWYAPEFPPPPPTAVVRPPVGRSAAAVRRRRGEGFAVLAVGVPIVAAGVILAFGVPAGPARVAAIAFAAVASLWFGAGLVMVGAGGERLDAWRLRRYERTLERVREERARYERTVDPAVERAKEQRLLRIFLVVTVAPVLVVLALLPAVLAGLAPSAPIRTAGAIASIVALCALAVWALRR